MDKDNASRNNVDKVEQSAGGEATRASRRKHDGSAKAARGKPPKAERALKQNEPKRSRGAAFVMLMICAALFVFTGICAAWTAIINGDEHDKEAERQAIIASGVFHDGISVNGVSISGMTMAQAQEALTTVEQGLADDFELNLTFSGQSFILDESNFHFSLNTQSILDEAIALGREGGLLKLKSEVDNYKDVGHSYEIEYVLDKQASVARLTSLLSNSIERDAVDASVQIKSGLETTYESVVEGYPFEILPGQDGLAIDYDALYESIALAAQAGEFGTLVIPTLVVNPTVDIGDVEDTIVLRAVFSTDFSSSSYNRATNVRRAARLCNKITLLPGEQFSCNDTIGPRTEALGWLPAPAVIDGGARTEDQAGGGVCQVSTTMYDCVVMSDLEIVYRRNHSSRSTYVRGGLDATINTDTIDFLWKNNTDMPVFLFMWTSGGTLYAAIYGEKFPDEFDRIEFVSELKEEVAPPSETLYRTLRSLPEGYWAIRNNAKTGYVYESFKKYYSGDELYDTAFVAESTYNAIAKCYFVWPGYSQGDYLDPAKRVSLDSEGNPILNPVEEGPSPTPDDWEQPKETPTPAG